MIDTFAIRCGVLRLAFSGKLTEQTETDGTAADILNIISPSKSIVQTENVPYGIPGSWAWVKLEDLYAINPRVNADGATEAAFVPMEKISGGFGRDFTFETQKWEQASKNHTKFEDNDVAFAKITPCFENRKSFIARGLPNGIGGGTTELIILRQKEMFPEYTYYLLLDQRFINTGTASYKGSVGQQRVQSDVIKNYFIPVAPLAEQQRIVKKINLAFSILDIVDELQTQYTENIAALKSKLIDAAIQGKLTKQLPEDGTAEELFQKIQEEKQALIKAGKIKKEKALAEITNDEIPFEIPDSWIWVRLSNLMLLMSTGPFGSMLHKSDYIENGIPVINPANIVDGSIIPSTKMQISMETKSRLIAYELHEGMIVMGRRGEMGRCAVVGPAEDGWLCGTGSFFMKPSSEMCSDFVSLIISSPYSKAFLSGQSIGMTMDNLNQSILQSMPVPLPPLAEQTRIMEKLHVVYKMLEN